MQLRMGEKRLQMNLMVLEMKVGWIKLHGHSLSLMTQETNLIFHHLEVIEAAPVPPGPPQERV
ncbi:hypothetical protein PoB_004110900, partial [Plakobranchus ocellatus]